ncbi:DUF3883 domain-containing protein [Ancylobacter sp. 6x-1]|uniref:DUF3883 domain-containing protein n=1 Tax=Ancylobacter crimeensis TaxID=2579147 RepID=A0ABT0D6Z9_9HYPH|nr:DUF3883 domain-containing protein [Ancylobacter crimeensis]MCK0195729.1 DUF3883 domain-containing protein [Ancylobacter crimeensis]
MIVADYFAMLADDIAGRPYNKAEHNRQLQERIDRTRTSIEFKHQNISAVLKGLGEDWIPGYKPAFNFQMTLVDAVARWLAFHPDWLGRMPGLRPVTGLQEAAQLWIGPPPTLSNQPPPQELEQMLHIARKFDVAGRDERNRALGRAGEERVLAHERASLQAVGREDLARKVRWVSEEDGDGAGYDIESFAPDGLSRLAQRRDVRISRRQASQAPRAAVRRLLGGETSAACHRDTRGGRVLGQDEQPVESVQRARRLAEVHPTIGRELLDRGLIQAIGFHE